MKTIESVAIWNNGKLQEAKILDAYAVNLSLESSATFYYSLSSENCEYLAQGNLTMTGEDYAQWQVDSYAWDWVANQLSLTITGDYVTPKPEQTEESI